MSNLPTQASFAFEYDDRTHILRSRIEGLLSMEQALAYREEWVNRVAEARRRKGFVRHVTDVRMSTAQLPDVAAIFQESMDSMAYSQKDRVATIVDSAILGMQIGRVSRKAHVRIFGCPEEADAWLMSPDDD